MILKIKDNEYKCSRMNYYINNGETTVQEVMNFTFDTSGDSEFSMANLNTSIKGSFEGDMAIQVNGKTVRSYTGFTYRGVTEQMDDYGNSNISIDFEKNTEV